MKVISIGNDPKIFQEGSAVRQRQIEYGKLFEELHIVVFSLKNYKSEKTYKLSENVFVYPTNSKNKLFCIWDTIRIVKTISYKIIAKSLVITTQDPFEIGVTGLFLKLFHGVPLHVQVHTDFNNKYFFNHSFLNKLRFLLARIVIQYADGVRVVSERIKKSILGLNKNIEVLPIAVEPFPAISIQRRPQSILTVCRLEKEKDIETAIKAFKIVSKMFPESIFTIAGEGSQKKVLEKITKDLDISEKVNFVGWISNLPELYGSHSIYISTSLFEGYGMSIMEAAQSGCVLVLSDAGIAGEIPGLVSKPKDIKSFVKNLIILLSDPQLQKEMGKRAQEKSLSMIISKGEYLERYKMGLERAYTNHKK